MTAIVLAPLASHPVRFVHLERLRLQECERVAALRTELTRCGARVEEVGETLTVYPSALHGAEVETYQDQESLNRKTCCRQIKFPAGSKGFKDSLPPQRGGLWNLQRQNRAAVLPSEAEAGQHRKPRQSPKLCRTHQV
jgi:hypothetical protein